jgi:hypothetical protein
MPRARAEGIADCSTFQSSEAAVEWSCWWLRQAPCTTLGLVSPVAQRHLPTFD